MAAPANPWTAVREQDEIRLMIVQPGSGLDIISCNFQHARLSNNPRYEALSYTWWPQGSARPIELNGQTHHIGENLWLALYHLRRPDATRVLWTDATCINQLDIGDRNHQFSLMGPIYTCADTVCVWLGPSDPSSDRAMKFLQQGSTLRSVQEANIKDPLLWEDVLLLFSKHYWERLWIIQDIILAQRVVVYCGDLALQWGLLSDILHTIKGDWYPAKTHEVESEIQVTDENPHFKALKDCMATKIVEQRRNHLRRQMSKEKVMMMPSIMLMMINYQVGKCTDVRDKVYAIHGFSPSCCKDAVPIDYTCSAWVLCHRLLQHHLSSHSSENSGENIVEISQDVHKLIMEGQFIQRDSTAFPLGGPDEFEAGEDLPASSIPSFTFGVKGYFHDTVGFVTPPLRTPFPMENISNIEINVPQVQRRRMESALPATTIIRINYILDIIKPTSWKQPGELNEPPHERVKINLPTVSEPPICLNETWIKAQKEISTILKSHPTANDCVLFFGKRGMVGLAAGGTEVGDTVCTFAGADVMAIVNEDPVTRKKVVMSRCCPIVSHETEMVDSVDLLVDVHGLQILTRPALIEPEDDENIQLC